MILFKNSESKNCAFQAPKPGFCSFAVTDKCMLKCENCFQWKNNYSNTRKLRPTIEDWKRCITCLRELVDDKNFVINFAGGEPLLFAGLLDIVSFANRLGFHTNIASNGWLIDEDMAKRIADSGLTQINISLDSLDEEVYDRMRGVKGAYRHVMNAIEYLSTHSANLNIGICTVIYNRNLDGIINLIEWVDQNDKLKWIGLMAATQPINTHPLDKEWYKHEYSYLWPKDIGKTCLIIDEILHLKNLGYKIGTPAHRLQAFKAYFQYPDKFARQSPCNFDRAFHVSSNGNVFLCHRYGQLGNIKNTDVRKLWYSENARKARKNIVTCNDNCYFLLNCA